MPSPRAGPVRTARRPSSATGRMSVPAPAADPRARRGTPPDRPDRASRRARAGSRAAARSPRPPCAPPPPGEAPGSSREAIATASRARSGRFQGTIAPSSSATGGPGGGPRPRSDRGRSRVRPRGGGPRSAPRGSRSAATAAESAITRSARAAAARTALATPALGRRSRCSKTSRGRGRTSGRAAAQAMALRIPQAITRPGLSEAATLRTSFAWAASWTVAPARARRPPRSSSGRAGPVRTGIPAAAARAASGPQGQRSTDGSSSPVTMSSSTCSAPPANPE